MRDSLGRKHCPKCDDWLSVESFAKSVKNCATDGLHHSCRDCSRAYRIWRWYKLTAEQVTVKLGEQGGVCAICEMPFVDGIPHVDHDHACCPYGKATCGNCVRGLLCGKCNRGLGMFNDSLAVVGAAGRYLERWSLR